ncbi:375_t:CDS:2 [Diversispora eburnea]|uniref:375_t:CDS:1 n=1 Tax=Diversispora eburnea TaxID=1213867 RepID=A0A9N9BSQ2_9GLOM|nr:375_t:CDS:2 [Diversispora eburnea]
MTNFILFGDHSSGEGIRGDFVSYEPSYEFKKFCCQIFSAGSFSSSEIILALLYIAKLKMKRLEDKIDHGTEHQVFICALMLANKFLNDISYGNKAWSDTLNISVSQLNIMEKEFLINLDFRLNVSEPEYHEWVHNLTKYIIGNNNISACSYVVPPPPSLYTEEDHQKVMVAFNSLLRREKLKRPAEKARMGFL